MPCDPQMSGHERDALQIGRGGVGGKGEVERRRRGDQPGGSRDRLLPPGAAPASGHRFRQRRDVGERPALTQDGGKHAVDEPPRPVFDQRQRGRDRRVGRRAEAQRLDQRDPQHETRLGVIGEPLLRRAVDQRVEIGKAPKGFGGDRMGERAVVGPVEVTRRRIERAFERQPLAQHGVEQPQGGATRGRTGRIGPAQLRRPSGSSALVDLSPAIGGGEWRPSSSAIASSAAIRFSVAGWVENQLSPRPRPGTM